MALFHHGHKLANLSHDGEVFGTLEHADHIIYQHYYPTGTVLATLGLPIQQAGYELVDDIFSNSYDSWFTQKNTYPLDIKKIHNGIKISGKLTTFSYWNGRTGGYSTVTRTDGTWNKSPVTITKAQLQSGTSFLIASPTGSDIPTPVNGQFDGTNLIIKSTTGLDGISSILNETHSGSTDGVSHILVYLTINTLTSY